MAWVRRVSSRSRYEFATSVARRAARTSPAQSLIASSTSTSKSGSEDWTSLGRCATLGRPRDVYAGADLRSGRNDLREAVGERAADQPLEPARDCQRSHATGPHREHLGALGWAFF